VPSEKSVASWDEDQDAVASEKSWEEQSWDDKPGETGCRDDLNHVFICNPAGINRNLYIERFEKECCTYVYTEKLYFCPARVQRN
jgi:hypothetical protein